MGLAWLTIQLKLLIPCAFTVIILSLTSLVKKPKSRRFSPSQSLFSKSLVACTATASSHTLRANISLVQWLEHSEVDDLLCGMQAKIVRVAKRDHRLEDIVRLPRLVRHCPCDPRDRIHRRLTSNAND